jgi:pimeloyl-ACP methyl ester carboxylesterase
MPNIVRRLRKAIACTGYIIAGIAGLAAIITLNHLIDTPQPLESALPGEARLYRWRSFHLFYKEMGTPENPPLVLLHNPGIGASAYEMRHIMAKLAEQYHVYAPDLPGFGLSDRPHLDYTVETYTAFCHDFLTEIVRRPATLLASGISCCYAVEVAEQFPDVCQRLVLISPVTHSRPTQQTQAFSALLPIPLFGLMLYALCSTRGALRWLLAQRNPQYRGSGQREQTKAAIDYFYATTHRFGAEHAPLALWAGKLSKDTSTQFETLRQPVLVIWGTQALQDTHMIASAYAIPRQAQLAIMRDAGIYVHEQYPAVVVTDIVDWSDGNSDATQQR